MIKMKQENYAQKMKKMRCILISNPLSVNKTTQLAFPLITIKYNRHIELKENATDLIPSASSNYILSIIFALK